MADRDRYEADSDSTNSTPVRNQRSGGSRRMLVVQDGEIGMVKNREFQSYTNFTVEVRYAVRSPEQLSESSTCFGFVYEIRANNGMKR